MKGYIMTCCCLLFFSMGAGEIFQGEESRGEGEGSGGKGREVGVSGEGSGDWGPPCPPPRIRVCGFLGSVFA